MIKKFLDKLVIMMLLQIAVYNLVEAKDITIYNESKYEMPLVYFKYDPTYGGSTRVDTFDMKKLVLLPDAEYTIEGLEDIEVERGIYYALPRCQQPGKQDLSYCTILGDELIGKDEIVITDTTRD